MRVDQTTGAARLTPRRARRAGPTLVAAAGALTYVLISPKSIDLAAQLLRVKVFGDEGFGLWNNWWYGGHYILGYSVLFPPLGWLIGPQVLAAVAVVASAAVFEALAHYRFGDDAWLGATWFGAASVTNLLSGRLTYAFGLLGALLVVIALQRTRPGAATAAAFLTALASPVAALFAALAGAAYALGDRSRRAVITGAVIILGALAPVVALAIAFPEAGSEPFVFSALWPIPVIAIVLLGSLPKAERTLAAGIVLYSLGCLAAYVVATPVGGNAVRLGVLMAGPLAGLLWYRRRTAWLVALALPLLYVQWQAAIENVATAADDPATTTAYYEPIITFLRGQPDRPFRIEIPFTRSHWEAYEMATQYPLARGWERQLDVGRDALFYAHSLSSAHYDAWLHRDAVRFVALPDVALDYSARREAALIRRGQPYLQLVFRSAHWRVYAVADPTPIATGVATVERLGADDVTLRANRPGQTLVRVRYSPYWALSGASGCVRPAGDFTVVDLRSAGPARLVMDFSIARIGARSARCI